MTVRTVLVTGGNRGIGFAIAEEFVAQGHRVAVTARSGEGPAGTLTVRADVTDGEALDAAFSEVEEKLGPVVDALKNPKAAVYDARLAKEGRQQDAADDEMVKRMEWISGARNIVCGARIP